MRCAKTLCSAILLLSAIACNAKEQPHVVDRAYTTPQWTSAHEFSAISGFRLLSDGRMIVSDVSDVTVVLLDSTGTLVTTIGRKGKGPGEYVDPRKLFALSNDTTLLVDAPLQRFLVLDPNGAVVRAESFPAAIGSQLRSTAHASKDGTIFFEPMPDIMTGSSQSVVLRWTPGSKGVDTIATVKTPEFGPAQHGSRDGVPMVMYMLVPYAHRDEWVALPNGGVAVVRAENYAIEVRGTADTSYVRRVIPSAPIAVTPEQREEVNASLRDRVPKFRQAFEPYYTIAGSDNEVWTRRTEVDSLSLPEWDVTDVVARTGYRVTLPQRSYVLAATRTKIYAVQYDDDDVQRLVIFAR